MANVTAGKLLAWQRTGNRYADSIAKKGAALHPSVADVALNHDRRCRALMLVARFASRINLRVHEKNYDATPVRGSRRPPGSAVRPRTAPPRVHDSNTNDHYISWNLISSLVEVWFGTF